MIEDNDENKIDHLTKFLNFSLFPCLYITELSFKKILKIQTLRGTALSNLCKIYDHI